MNDVISQEVDEVLNAHKIWKSCAVAIVGNDKVNQIDKHYQERMRYQNKMQADPKEHCDIVDFIFLEPPHSMI